MFHLFYLYVKIITNTRNLFYFLVSSQIDGIIFYISILIYFFNVWMSCSAEQSLSLTMFPLSSK